MLLNFDGHDGRLGTIRSPPGGHQVDAQGKAEAQEGDDAEAAVHAPMVWQCSGEVELPLIVLMAHLGPEAPQDRIQPL